jgi:excisionase family DNA binding protein
MKDSSSLTRVNNAKRKEPTPLLTAQDACEYLQCTRRFLERMVRNGRLRALKPTRKFLRFRQTDVDAFLDRGATMGAWR